MKKPGLNELRERFLKFFESKGHLVMPSFSLVPQNDPSILLINAGMTPLKPYFTGEQKPPSLRVATCQKCIRTPDIERVGKTARHGTFFEMLGNFSFGDYFKKEAASWAWEFFTEDLKMPEDKLWVSIYEEDDEAYDIWKNHVGIPPGKIVRLGKEDNFWEHGTGPCGPCSEIHFDRGADKGCKKPGCKVGCDCDRYIEVWNLVFTQFSKNEDGEYTKLEKKNIDTGMGLERLAAVIQDADSLFEVDTIRNVLDRVCEITGKEYGKAYKNDVSIRVITDHIRSTVFMVSDGIIPSNEGRGYVLRRLLRRASRHGRLLGLSGLFLYGLVDVVINESGDAYPGLKEKSDYIKKVIKMEEERFETTIDQGLVILNEMVESLKEKRKDTIPGDMAFKLHDTYGFPLDLTREIADENGLKVDEDGFILNMGRQKEKAREALKHKESQAWGGNTVEGIDPGFVTAFSGYLRTKDKSEIAYIIKDGMLVDSITKGERAAIISPVTPMYAESGGQVGDTGSIFSQNGSFSVEDTKKTVDGKAMHIGMVNEGRLCKGDDISIEVENGRRIDIARNHTVTHLLQKALKNRLGDHVTQAGSLVQPDRLRFDFTHFAPLTQEELDKVENEVNEKIFKNLSVCTEEMELGEAKKKGALALFGEKYGDSVRVVSIGDYSVELCGGTHLASTSQAGVFKIAGESGIAAGVRRIEALTGKTAVSYFNEKEKILDKLSSVLKTAPLEVVRKVEGMTAQLKEAKKEIEALRSKLVGSKLDGVIAASRNVNGVQIISSSFDNMDVQALRNTGDELKNRVGDSVVILAASNDGKVNLIVTATKGANKKGIHCGNIVKEAARLVGGGGGGRADMAQAGGKNPGGITGALEKAVEIAGQQLSR